MAKKREREKERKLAGLKFPLKKTVSPSPPQPTQTFSSAFNIFHELFMCRELCFFLSHGKGREGKCCSNWQVKKAFQA